MPDSVLTKSCCRSTLPGFHRRSWPSVVSSTSNVCVSPSLFSSQTHAFGLEHSALEIWVQVSSYPPVTFLVFTPVCIDGGGRPSHRLTAGETHWLQPVATTIGGIIVGETQSFAAE